MSIGPLQLAFYKGLTGKFGAVQFNPQKPHYYVKDNPKLKNFDGKFIKEEWKQQHPNLTESDLASREGAIFLEITSTKDKNVYDWENKIIMALSVTDMGQILEVLTGSKPECKIMHDPGANSANRGKVQKYLHITSPKGIKEGILINAMKKEPDGDKVAHTVPLSGHEVLTLRAAIQGFIPAALGWG